MTVSNSLLRTDAAEALVQRLLPRLVADIEADHLTRRGSLEQLRRLLAQAGYIPSPDGAAVVCLQLADAFAAAGFRPLMPTEVQNLAPMPAVIPAPDADTLPWAVREAVRIAGTLAQHAAVLASCGLQVAMSGTPPWAAGFLDAECSTPGEVVLYPWQGETAGNGYLGCLLAGAERSVYLDEAGDNPAGILDASARLPVEAMRVNVELGKLRATLGRFNDLSALTVNQGHFDVAMPPDKDALTLTWQGQVVHVLDFADAMATAPADAAATLADLAVEAVSMPGGMR